MNTGRRSLLKFATAPRHLSTVAEQQPPAAYCRDLVRSRDYESFLTSHFYPKHLQDGYFALKAFYVHTSTLLCEQILTCILGGAGHNTGYCLATRDRENAYAVLARCCQKY